jgi:hypothetical protein
MSLTKKGMNLKIYSHINSNITSLLLILAVMMLPSSVVAGNGPNRQFIKTINREFSTSNNGMTAIYNRYGKININTWQKNTVKIDITITVNTEDEDVANKMFKRIQVNFTSTNGYIKAETMLMQDKSWWPSEGASQDFKINYEVWMPINNQLDLKNKYGNSYIAALNGKLIAEIKLGDLRAEAITADVDLNITNGKAFFTKVHNLSGSVSFGALTLTEAWDLQIDTKNSEFNIEKAGIVRLTSVSDNFNFGTLSDLRLHTKYSGLKIKNAKNVYVTAQYTDVNTGNVSEVVDIDICYGNLVVNALSKNFTNVNVIAKFADVKLLTERGTVFQFDAQGTSTGLYYPATATIRKHNDNGSYEIVQGYVGDANAKGFVKVKMNNGDFVLK